MFVLPFAFGIASLQQHVEDEKSLSLGLRAWVNHFAPWFHNCKEGGIVILSACFPLRIVQRITLGNGSTFIITIRLASPASLTWIGLKYSTPLGRNCCCRDSNKSSTSWLNRSNYVLIWDSPSPPPQKFQANSLYLNPFWASKFFLINQGNLKIKQCCLLFSCLCF